MEELHYFLFGIALFVLAFVFGVFLVGRTKPNRVEWEDIDNAPKTFPSAFSIHSAGDITQPCFIEAQVGEDPRFTLWEILRVDEDLYVARNHLFKTSWVRPHLIRKEFFKSWRVIPRAEIEDLLRKDHDEVGRRGLQRFVKH